MAANWSRPYELRFPLDAKQVEEIDSMFQKLFSKLPLLATRGGTGLSGYLIGDLLYADSVETLATIAAVSAGSYLRSAGVETAPVWSTVKIPNAALIGDLWYGSATDTISALNVGTVGKVIRTNGTLPVWSTFTIPDTYAQGDILYSSATNVLTALVKDTNASRYLSNKGASNAPTWAQVTLTNGVTGTLPVGNGGTGLTAIGEGSIIQGNAGTFIATALGSAGAYLRAASGIVVWSTLILPNAAAQGDTFIATATNVMTVLAKNTTATRYLSNTGASNNPAWAQVDVSNGITGDLPFANLAQGSALSVLGVTGNATADNASIAAGTDHQVLRRSGTTVAFGAIDLSQAAAITGDLPDANLTANVPLINATNAFTGANSFATNVLDLLVGQLKFPATQNASTNANTLDDYEEGTWTPADGSGAGLSLTVTSATYVKVGQIVWVTFDVTYPITANGANALVSGLPFASHSSGFNVGLVTGYSDLSTVIQYYGSASDTTMNISQVGGLNYSNVTLSAKRIIAGGTYRAAS